MVEEVLQRGAEQVDHKDIVKTFLTEVVHIRNASCKAPMLALEG